MHYSKAIVRKPPVSYTSCITSHPMRHAINREKALTQHKIYCDTLESLGIEIFELHIKEKFPDSCFVEDTAVIHNRKALINHLGAKSRRGEEKAVAKILSDYMKINIVQSPATIEGGDIIHTNSQLICGITSRTNKQGFNILKDWLDPTAVPLVNNNIVHLKSYATYIADGIIVITEEFSKYKEFSEFNKIIVPQEEYYAANTLTVNRVTIIPKGYDGLYSLLKEKGLEVLQLEMSQFCFCEGALTCLSLLF